MSFLAQGPRRAKAQHPGTPGDSLSVPSQEPVPSSETRKLVRIVYNDGIVEKEVRLAKSLLGPSEEYTRELQDRISSEFGLSSYCEFKLQKGEKGKEVAHSLRHLEEGDEQYDLILTRTAATIPRLTSPEDIIISLSGTGIITKHADELLLQVSKSNGFHDASCGFVGLLLA